MQTGRADYDNMSKFAGIPAAEPRMIIRAQDSASGDAVRAWVALSAMQGVPPATLEAALQLADAMDAWPVKKLPGDDHLTDQERKQLEYQHRRRQWDAGTGVPWRLAAARDHTPADPAALLGQLAKEQQVLAERHLSLATFYWSELDSADPKVVTRHWISERARGADEAANRAAYFLSVATALRFGQVALSPNALNEHVA